MTLYEDLGVPPDASSEEIRKAYRERASKEHPDKGGSVKRFQVIQKAYSVLGKRDKRARYDASGEAEEGPTIRSQALQQLAMMMFQLIDRDNKDPEWMDLMGELRNIVQAGNKRLAESEQTTKAKAAGYLRVAKRMRGKKGKQNVLKEMILRQAKATEESLVGLKEKAKVGKEMWTILEDHEYDFQANSSSAEGLYLGSVFTFRTST